MNFWTKRYTAKYCHQNYWSQRLRKTIRLSSLKRACWHSISRSLTVCFSGSPVQIPQKDRPAPPTLHLYDEVFRYFKFGGLGFAGRCQDISGLGRHAGSNARYRLVVIIKCQLLWRHTQRLLCNEPGQWMQFSDGSTEIVITYWVENYTLCNYSVYLYIHINFM